jgi:hypothetical protein
LELTVSFGKHGDTSVTDQVITYDWLNTVPWTPEDLKLVTIDAGSGFTIPGDTFEAGDVVGLRVLRLGSAAEDTFPHSLAIVTGVLLEYTAKQI